MKKIVSISTWVTANGVRRDAAKLITCRKQTRISLLSALSTISFYTVRQVISFSILMFLDFTFCYFPYIYDVLLLVQRPVSIFFFQVAYSEILETVSLIWEQWPEDTCECSGPTPIKLIVLMLPNHSPSFNTIFSTGFHPPYTYPVDDRGYQPLSVSHLAEDSGSSSPTS